MASLGTSRMCFTIKVSNIREIPIDLEFFTTNSTLIQSKRITKFDLRVKQFVARKDQATHPISAMPAIRYKSLPLWAIYAFMAFLILLVIWYLQSPKQEKTESLHSKTKLINKYFNVKKIPQKKDPGFDFMKTIEKMVEEKTAMNDVELVDLIRNYFIHVPSDDDTYNLEEPGNLRFSAGLTSYVDQRLHGQEKLFYIETRAFSGEKESTTLFFEQSRQWSGLLVEPDPVKFETLKRKNRKAYLLNACITDKAYPTKMEMFRPDGTDISKPGSEKFSTFCFPLYSVLLALRQKDITLLTLNFYEVGSQSQTESDLLASLPYDRINITFVAIRNLYSKKIQQGVLDSIMEREGYESQGRLRTDDQWVNDLVFLNKNNHLPVTPFWTTTNIMRAVILFIIIYGIANVVAYKYLFPRLHLYKLAYDLV
ncbi:uncharacterized protein [Argopecten irradians]|uniref:uncharacterized protein isoform X2 n=1 Tax=Argopecten irradians TaxID=31199 RepID=UPI003715EEC4